MKQNQVWCNGRGCSTLVLHFSGISSKPGCFDPQGVARFLPAEGTGKPCATRDWTESEGNRRDKIKLTLIDSDSEGRGFESLQAGQRPLSPMRQGKSLKHRCIAVFRLFIVPCRRENGLNQANSSLSERSPPDSLHQSSEKRVIVRYTITRQNF